MTRSRVQLDISIRVPKLGKIVRRWPIAELATATAIGSTAGLYATIAEVVQARRPKFGALYLVALADTGDGAPTYERMIKDGIYGLIGHYRSADERAALLSGEIIDDGKSEQA